jgi:hypothetical protein
MSCRRLSWAVLAGLVAWVPVVAPAAFRADFEKGLDADQSGGAAKAMVAGAVTTVGDRFGTSLVLGPGPATCGYEALGNLDLAQGTLVTWLLPTGWQAGGGASLPIVRARQGPVWLALWWDPSSASLRVARGDAAGRAVGVAKTAYDWVQPTWRHVVVTWTAEAVALYVDGQPGTAATAVGTAPECSDGQFVLGGDFGGAATLASRGVTVLTEALPERSVQERYRIASTGRIEHERPLIALVPCAQAPVIDGKLAPGEWDLAAGTTGLVEIASGMLSSVATRLYLTYDQECLYAAFRCPSAEAPVANPLARDTGSPWDEDSVELWLQPEVGFTGKYFHLVLNAAGGLFDFEDQNAAWNGTRAWAAARGEGEWTAEVAVPHAGMGTLPPSAKTTWQANFCRNVGPGATTNRHTAWAYTAGSSYGVWQWFGALRFGLEAAVVRLDALAASAGGTSADFALQMGNPGREPVTLDGSVFLYRQGAAGEDEECALGPWALAPGASRVETARAAAPFPVDQVRVQVRDAGTGRVLLAQMVRAGAVAAVAAAATPTTTAPAAGTTVAAPILTDERLGAVIRERALWQDNRLGITDKVPPPWTPLSVDGQAVSCWGRTYDCGGSLLPARIQSQGVELLAEPIRLLATVQGQDVLLQAAEQQSLTPAAHQVDIEAAGSAAGLTARTSAQIEYDGCVRVELTLAPGNAAVVLDRLELRLTLPRERALYYHWFEATRDPRLTNAGALPAAGLKSHFKPLLWLGDDDRGLCWFSESPKGWAIADRESTLQVEVGERVCSLRICLADRPLVVAGPWRTVFGLMATPVRPMPPGWRDWLIPLNQSNPWSSWAPGFNNLSGTDDPGTLMPKDAPAMKVWIEEVRQRGLPTPFLPQREPVKVIPYSQIVFWSGKYRDGMPAPEIMAFGPEWSNAARPPGPRREPDAQIPLKEYYWVCPQSSFADYYLYKLDQLIDATGIDGIYIDGPWNTCSNPLHGCGYLDDQGQWQREYKIWPFRELLKRVYCLLHAKVKDPIIHHHTSCWLCIPSISFSDMILDGEQYHDAGQKVEDHFLDIVPLDKWRAEHTGRQWGPAPFLLPDIPGQWCQSEAPTRELLLLTNLHDTGLFPAGNNTRLVMRNYQARRMFGVADCDFRGYWGNAEWVTCTPPEAKVSVYRQPDGSRCLLVVGNTAKTDHAVTVRPNLAGLKLLDGPIGAGVDLETGERLALAEGQLTVPVKARDYRLVALPFYTAPAITAGDARASALQQVPNPGFETGLDRWQAVPVEGNAGRVSVDRECRHAGEASCHLHKADGPGGMMVQTEDVFVVAPGQKHRANCQLRIANSTGAKAYWMISMQDVEGNTVGTNNHFSVALAANQDWTPYPFEFLPLPGTAVIRVHFLVAFPGTADAWIDEVSLEAVK